MFLNCLLGSSHYIVWSTSSDKGALCLVGGKKNKNKNLHFESGRRKNKKEKLESDFNSKNKRIQWEFIPFREKKSFYFWACRRKK